MEIAFRLQTHTVSLAGTVVPRIEASLGFRVAGTIMRNSVILVDQIDQDIRAGHDAWSAVIDATVRRARPILLAAGIAIFAMIPLSRSMFFGPMAGTDGRPAGGDRAYPALSAGTLRGMVQGEASGRNDEPRAFQRQRPFAAGACGGVAFIAGSARLRRIHMRLKSRS
jgi:hypothetical protein